MKKVDTIGRERTEHGRPPRRVKRCHSSEFKARVVAECEVRGASVAGVSLAHGVNANLVRKWIIKQRRALAPTGTTPLLPVRITTEEVATIALPKRSGGVRRSDALEIELAGASIRVGVDFDADLLGAVLRVVRDTLLR
jgi:transposase